MKPFLFSLCLLFFFGCEKATEYNSSPRDNFEALWRIMDENYCFFAFKDEENDGAFAVVYKRNDGGYGLIEDVQ